MIVLIFSYFHSAPLTLLYSQTLYSLCIAHLQAPSTQCVRFNACISCNSFQREMAGTCLVPLKNDIALNNELAWLDRKNGIKYLT